MTGKQIVTVAECREAVQCLVTCGLSQRGACVLLPWERSTLSYQPRPDRHAPLGAQIHALALQHPRTGDRRVWAWLRRRGQRVNKQHVHRFWKRATRQVRTVRRKGGLARPAPVSVQATYPGHV